MFLDKVEISVRAGNGGNGAVSFRREKYVPNGGPDGGDGGKGGDIIIEVDKGISTLNDFKYKRKYKAEDGQKGQGSKSAGRGGKDTVIKVPPGTVVRNLETETIIADFDTPDKSMVIAKGGKGGMGNRHFANSTRQTPRFATPGTEGEELKLALELKLIADAGLIGFPNAGKSTLLSVVSEKKPKIADYPFTTITPNLGVVEIGIDSSFVMADIPGIIEGAAEGVGLGHEFLRHVERTKLLVHIVDLSEMDGRDVIYDYEKINEELKKYSKRLAKRPQIVVGNKIDITGYEEKEKKLKERAKKDGFEYFSISCSTNKGIKPLINKIYHMVKNLPEPVLFEPEEYEVVYKVEKEKPYSIRKENDKYIIEGKWAEKIFKSTNFDDYESLQFFQRVMKQKGVIEDLEKMGIEEGDTVKIFDLEFEFVR